MNGNVLVRFLGEDAAVTPHPYPTHEVRHQLIENRARQSGITHSARVEKGNNKILTGTSVPLDLPANGRLRTPRQMEYQVVPDWKIGTSTTSTGSNGIDVIWHKRY